MKHISPYLSTNFALLKMRAIRCVRAIALMTAGFAGPVAAVTYTPPLEHSRWQVDESIFECKLRHDIPYYGEAVFERRAGEQQQFYLDASTSRLQSGKASVVAESPLWRPRGGKRELALVPVSAGTRPMALGRKLSERMLSELHQGMQVVVTRQPWYGADESLRVAMVPVNFQLAYRDYLGCLGDLLPVNFEQVSRLAIYFQPGVEGLPASERRKLDNIAIYVKADPSVTAFFVDGHTDSRGARAENLELSQMRAELVKQYLIDQGVEPSKITTRWHGERYPVESNRTATGRAKNRRVTVRLHKGEVEASPGAGSGAPAAGAATPAISANPPRNSSKPLI